MKEKIAAVTALAMTLTMLGGCGTAKEKTSSGSSSAMQTETETTAETQTETTTEQQTSIPEETATAETDDSSAETAPEKKLTPEYDTSAIVEAYRSGDKSGLSEFDTQIYDKAAEIISEVVTDDMDDYDKELALHDWMLRNITYDAGALKAIPQPSEHCEDPYGALVNGSAICMGYTTSFNMLMGMVDIPCIIIHSTDYQGDEHAWNAVELDGSWYYVDVTWDDPVPDEEGRPVFHRFFNVTYDFMDKEHEMTDDCPGSVVGEYSYAYRNAVVIDSIDEIKAVAEQSIADGNSNVDLIFSDESLIEGKVKFYGGTGLCTDKQITDSFKDIGGEKYTPVFVDKTETDKGTVYSFSLMKLNGLFG